MRHSSKENDNETFSFYNHKSFFEQLLGDENHGLLLEDKSDFWVFVSKYEGILRKTEPKGLCQSLEDKDIQSLQPFHKRKFISLNFTDKWLAERKRTARSDPKVSNLQIAEFKDIILIYLDFKQKEKFNNIKKVRQSQKTLPIWRYKNEIQLSLEETRVLIVAGDTGCGKSTQIPQYLHEFGYKSIACTQPRRLACVSLSKRVAHETLNGYGCKVGFQIRFEKNRTSFTNILFITEGLLLRQLAVDSNLGQYDVLILDEIHERNLFGDFLLGVTKCILRAKPTLKLILMSATINVDLFYSYFKNDGAKLIQVPGRLFPIKTMYMPPPALELKRDRKRTSQRLDPAPYIQILNLIDQKYPSTERGDVLIFVSGVNEIVSVCDAVNEYAKENHHWIVLPLHSGLSLAEQDKVFDYAPDGSRKCIVSTNIAETSITVDGIRFVVDSGKVKEMSYDSSCKGQRLKEFWVSKSSAEQRTGRAGRTGPGTCFRLFSKEQYESLEPYPTPEIFRVPLDTILLQMIALGLPNVRKFPFIEAPSEEHIEHTILALKKHNALTPDEKITPLGKSLSNLPVDISIGKMLLMSCVFPDMEKVLTLAAVLSVQNPFTSRAFTDPKCEQQRSSMESDQGDIFTLLRVYNEWLRLKLDRENSRKWCHKLGIEEQRFYEIAKLRNQFENILVSCKLTFKKSTDDNFSSSERARRHGEVRFLKSVKRKQKYQDTRKRKILRKDINEDFSNDDGEDIRDVDFHLYHDSLKIETLIKSSNAVKERDVLLLKLAMISGFYPQMAIADEFNYCKGGSYQFFHTALKSFVSIYPNAYFAKYFDILKLNDSDILPKPTYYTPKVLLSSAHQVLCFQNLLETTKPYLMNCIRMPAAQALLLFSYAIDTNLSISRIVCDSWLCLDFPLPEAGCDLLCQAINLRSKWKNILKKKLEAEDEENHQMSDVTINDVSEDLWELLIDFMRVDVAFTIKRLLPADLKNLYTHDSSSIFGKFHVNPFDAEYVISANDEKGGINVTENVVYGSVIETDWSIAMDAIMNQDSWKCKYCECKMESNTITKLLHKKQCKPKKHASSDDKVSSFKQQSTGSSSKGRQMEYHCNNCGKVLYNTKIEILKHSKFCK